MEASQAQKKVKHRSPSYPSIAFEKAMERTQQLWDIAGKHPAPLESAVKGWGYSARSSGGLQTVAALKQYGLAADSGSGWNRQVQLTSIARELLVYGTDRGSEDWRTRAKRAVLSPRIHRELWEQYSGSLPDDSVMLPDLRLERGFSDEAARDMLKRFRASISFAGMTAEAGTLSPNGQDTNGQEQDDQGDGGGEGVAFPATLQQKTGEQQTPPVTSHGHEPRTVQVTYSPEAWALVQAPFPMSEADWNAMMRVLDGMKPGLVTPDSE